VIDQLRTTQQDFEWRQLWSRLIFIAMCAFVVVTLSACWGGGSSSDDDDDGGDDGGDPPVTVPAPGAPTNLTAVRTPDQILSATLGWSAPLEGSGGDPDSYEVYRTQTDPAVAEIVDEENLVISIPAVDGQADYQYVDNAGVLPGDNWWVVSAKNAGGETPSEVAGPVDIKGPPSGGGDEGYGNNFAAAMIFADGIGIAGDTITGTWTNVLADVDVNTGLRPKAEEKTALAALPTPVINLPHLDDTTIYTVGGIDYYKQQTASTWQGMWVDGSGSLAPHSVTGKWGDNLISQRLTEDSVIRVEMVLTENIAAMPMESYWMLSLYGEKRNEIYGTDGTTYDNPTAFVFAANAHLTIEKLDGSGNRDGNPLYDQTLWLGDGPGFLAGEVNVAGNFTYGFVWNLKDSDLAAAGITTGKTGTWRITFSLDPTSPKGTLDNTDIVSVANGVLVPAPNGNGDAAQIDIVVR